MTTQEQKEEIYDTPCCKECEIYLDYKDAYQCNNDECECHKQKECCEKCSGPNKNWSECRQKDCSCHQPVEEKELGVDYGKPGADKTAKIYGTVADGIVTVTRVDYNTSTIKITDKGKTVEAFKDIAGVAAPLSEDMEWETADWYDSFLMKLIYNGFENFKEDREPTRWNIDGSKLATFIHKVVSSQRTQLQREIENKIEALAELEHDQWVTWSKNLVERERLSPERVERWSKLWKPYAELTEEEKDQDRMWAHRALSQVLELKELNK